MYKLTSRLLLFSDLGGDSVLEELARIFEAIDTKSMDKDTATHEIYVQIKRLLDLATAYGFDGNLWQNYLTFLLVTNENSLTLSAERDEEHDADGSVYAFARQDFDVFRRLFHYDFRAIESGLGIDCFSRIVDYKSIPKRACLYNRSVSDVVRDLSHKLAAADTDGMFDLLIHHYRTSGVGMFGLNRAFRITNEGGRVTFLPINNADTVRLCDLVGYEIQKRELVDNTRAFAEGKRANNVLLYGDSGTGKSTSIKAVLNEYYESGVRMIEIYKHQFRDLSAVIAAIKNRNYRFIIYIDDLSFEEHEVEYKFLKAVIEGGVETRPENVLIYATSNRRHLIKETWNDRNDMEFSGEVHRSDTIEEKLSLSARFGVSINFSSPDREQFFNIVRTLAEREGIEIEEQQLRLEANRWEMRHGGLSGRTARQFVDHLNGTRNHQ